MMLLAAALRRPSAAAMEARDAARRKVVTVGDIVRLAAARCAKSD
jgi:hypothetical protein